MTAAMNMQFDEHQMAVGGHASWHAARISANLDGEAG
jgi:hypothetical protein